MISGSLTISMFLYRYRNGSSELDQLVIQKNKSTCKKIAIFNLPKTSSLDQFKLDIGSWVNLDKYDKIKYKYIDSGRILVAKSDFSEKRVVFHMEFLSNEDLVAFENELIAEKVFNSVQRKKLGYFVKEYFSFHKT